MSAQGWIKVDEEYINLNKLSYVTQRRVKFSDDTLNDFLYLHHGSSHTIHVTKQDNPEEYNIILEWLNNKLI